MAVNSLDLLFRTLDELESAELKRFRTYLSERTVEGFEPIPRGKLEGKDATDVASMMKNAYGEEGSVKMTLTILRKMNLNNLVDKLERPQTQRPPSPVPSGVSMNSMPEHPTFSSGPVPSGLKDVAESGDRDVDAILQEVKAKYKEWMIEKFGKIHECIEDGKNKTLLRKIYTELYITEGESEGVNTQHEIRRIETQIKFQRANEDKINCNDIFKCLPDQEKIRTVMTTGIAGIGKSVCVQKFILDWAEERAHQDVDFIFALPFRQLNLKQNDSYSLHKLLHVFHKLNENDINPDVLCKLKIMFIFDGLDESKLPLNVEQDMDDPLKTASVDVLITNLITGNLLPNALIWITSRPAAVKMIPPKYIDRWTEVQGFNDQQKDEYFKKKIENPAKIARIKRSKSLYIMCHIPVFCWILASVLLKMNSHTNTSDLPQTLTEVYICFLLTETNRKGQKYGKGFERDDKKRLKSNKDAILKLSELAYKELLKGNILFYEDNLNECGINEEDITLYSGMCSEFFMSECAVDQRKVYCFVHLSIQEFLAALFVFHSFVTKNTEALRQFISQESLSNLSMAEFLRTAIDKSMQKEDGQLDLFLRFLLGMSLESNQKLLQGLLTHIESSSDSLKETAEHIKRILSKDTKVPERCMNLLLCLLEMKDNSLHQEIQQYIDSGEKLSPAQCSTLAYMLLVSEETLDELDLAKYKSSNEGRQRLLIVVKACRKARLVGCDLREDSCEVLTSAFQSDNSQLKELDLSSNPLRDSGVRLLSVGLKHTNCRLETLRLADCKLTHTSCKTVASILQSPNSLLVLDLSNNNLGDSGVQLLFTAMSSPNCKLQTLRCAESNLTDKFCEIMASVLQSPNSLLQLDLSDLGDSGVQLLSKGLSNHHCKLHTLRLAECKLSEKSCGIVATVLQSPNSLIELDLSHNDVGDTGVQLVSKGLSSPRCKLHTLRLAECTLSEKSCRIVATVLQSPNSLIELDLSHNDLGDSGVQLLFKGLSSHCKLQTLRFAGCILTDKSCEIMASVLQSPNSLIELDLSHNDLGDLGVQLLFNGLSSPYCALQTLRFAGCKLTDQSCEIVTSVLQSVNSAQLQQLDLSHNDLGDSGVQPLSKGLSSPYCNLQTLRLRKCGFSDEGYVCLALTLMLNPSCVKKLDVNNNHPGESAQKLLSSTLKDPHRKVEALRFAGCKLTFQSCEIVTLVLQSTNLAQLRHLDLSHNDLGDSGVQLLSKGLSSPHCKLQILRLRKCGFSDEGYVCLALTLMLNPTCVKELDVSNNYPGGSAQKLLSATLEDPHRKVEALRLAECTLTEKSFVSVATVLQSPNVLIELDLSHNDLRDSRVQLLSKGLSSLHCKLRALRLSECTLSEKSCGIVATVLQSPNSLIELDLSHNDLRDSGVQLLSTGLYSSHCKLQALRLAECKLSEKSCEIVATALQSPNSLIKLDLSYNDLRDSGVQLLMNELSSSHYRLQTVRFAGCKLSEKSCGIVATVLKSPNSLIELDLSHNDLGDSGVQLLSKGLSSPHCKLHTLRLAECKLLEKYCGIVATVLQSPNSMIELDLSHNYLGDSGVQLLSKGLSSPHCKLQTLRVMLADCKLTDKLCKIVTSVLQSPNSLLLLDLSGNDLGDSGTQLLSEGLSSSNCILQTLRLADCKLAEKSCEIVASILQLPNSLLQLDLSDNELGDSGVQLLSKGLSSSNCKIHTLRLSDCLILEKGCGFLASALRSNPFHLKEMDLSYNHPGESGLELLSGRLEDPVCKLELLKTDDASVSRTRPCLLKYACELTVDPNTAGRNLSLSDGNRKVTRASEKQLYPDHPERFDWKYQVLCRESLSGRCYWEAEWSGDAARIAVAYKSIKRKGEADDIIMGLNAKSWSLRCSPDSYSAWHNNKHTVIPSPSSRSRRVGVYLDWPDGTLSFYSVSSDTLTHLHTFHSTFTEPLCPGFWVWSSVSLCQILHLRHSVSNRKRWLLHRFYSNLKNFISTFENTSVLQPKNKIVW
ncbi:protein NLRC5-like isoform X19 [Alosa sapidissima]|uniref:protein NLRC5-like isoform X19 n=1 Tax=Alosa sapidissima TaxID=34773 RepID=UPI001C080893|nr:protein NLRC5-like isoform X19 [Alosa sapidissima]